MTQIDISPEAVEHLAVWAELPGNRDASKCAAYLRALRAALDRAEARTSELEACLDAAEKDCRISDNGNMWRFWADKCREMAARLTRAEADAREAALQYLSDTGQMMDRLAAMEADKAVMRKALERIKQDAGGWPYDAACDALAPFTGGKA